MLYYDLILPIFSKFEKPIYGDEAQSFTNFMAPGIALSVIFFLSVASTASNYVLERQLGLVERSYLAGVRTIELLLSQLIIYSLIMLIQIVIVLCLLFFFLGLPLVGSMPLLVALLSSQGFCGLCYGLCLAALTHDQETVSKHKQNITISLFNDFNTCAGDAAHVGLILPDRAHEWHYLADRGTACVAGELFEQTTAVDVRHRGFQGYSSKRLAKNLILRREFG